MDLVTYLKNTNNDELCKKLKEIVKLYKEREENKKAFIELNNAYNDYLTKKHKSKLKKSKTTKNRIENNLEKLEDINPLFLFLILMLLPTPLLVLATILIQLVLLVNLVNLTTNEVINVKDESINTFEKFDQDEKYKKLCEARELYHTKRKELDSALLNISNKDLELINDFYGALEEYEILLDHIANDLEDNKQLPQVETPKKLENIINY